MEKMKRFVLTSLGGAAVAVALASCTQSEGQSEWVPEPEPYSAGSLAAGTNTWNHPAQSVGGENGITDTQQKAAEDALIGTPDVVARLHGAQKVQYASLGIILGDLGVNVNVPAPPTNGGNGGKGGKGGTTPASTTPLTAGQLYAGGQSALGVALYASRVPEMIIPSTSALAKEFDIFTQAATEILKGNLASSTRCPSTQLIDATGQFTHDGVSCLMGKPAKPDHLTLANQLVTAAPDAATGQQLAIATLLAAAHTSE
jgi:hypothetical protein